MNNLFWKLIAVLMLSCAFAAPSFAADPIAMKYGNGLCTLTTVSDGYGLQCDQSASAWNTLPYVAPIVGTLARLDIWTSCDLDYHMWQFNPSVCLRDTPQPNRGGFAASADGRLAFRLIATGDWCIVTTTDRTTLGYSMTCTSNPNSKIAADWNSLASVNPPDSAPALITSALSCDSDTQRVDPMTPYICREFMNVIRAEITARVQNRIPSTNDCAADLTVVNSETRDATVSAVTLNLSVDSSTTSQYGGSGGVGSFRGYVSLVATDGTILGTTLPSGYAAKISLAQPLTLLAGETKKISVCLDTSGIRSGLTSDAQVGLSIGTFAYSLSGKYGDGTPLGVAKQAGGSHIRY